MFDNLFDLFDRDHRRSPDERKRGLSGLLDRLSGEEDDVRSNRRRTDDWDDDREYGHRRRDEFWDD